MAVQDFKKAVEYQNDKGVWAECMFIGRPTNADIVNKNWIEYQDDKGVWVTAFVPDDKLRNRVAAVADGIINLYPDHYDPTIYPDQATADAAATKDRSGTQVMFKVGPDQYKFERREIEVAAIDVDIDPTPIEPVIEP